MDKPYIVGTILTNDEVIEFAESIHYSKKDFEEGDIVDRLERFSTYELREISVKDLEDPCHYIDEELIEEYKQKDINKIPPVILGYYQDGSFMTIDGGHRTTILKQFHIEKALAFVGIK